MDRPQKTPDLYTGFFESFGRAVIEALPEHLRQIALDHLDDIDGAAPTLLIILAHAGRAHRSMPKIATTDAMQRYFDEAVSCATLSLRRALTQPTRVKSVCRYLPPKNIANDTMPSGEAAQI